MENFPPFQKIEIFFSICTLEQSISEQSPLPVVIPPYVCDPSTRLVLVLSDLSLQVPSVSRLFYQPVTHFALPHQPQLSNFLVISCSNIMASFAMTKDELATATLDAIKARAVELGSPLSDGDAAGLTKLMGGLELEDVTVTEEQFKKTIAKIGGLPKDQFDGMLMMSKMMGGAGIESVATSLAAAMSGGAATTEATTEKVNTQWITVIGSGTSECDGLYCPSTAPPTVSESGIASSVGYWNGKLAWDREDGCAKRNPSLSYSNSYKAWRIARLDGHLAYTIVNDDDLPTVGTPWDVYKKGVSPPPSIAIYSNEAAARQAWSSLNGLNAGAASFGETKAQTSPPNVVFVLGGPGAGKGTMCALAQNQLGFKHLSAGDLLRAERNSGSANADLINSFIEEGKIVPVEITVGLIKVAMATCQETNFLIDGFPRSLNNYEGWNKVMGTDATVKFMLFFECPLPILEERILGRAKYSGRKDDNVESLRKRFNVYKTETMPIVNLFRAENKCGRWFVFNLLFVVGGVVVLDC